jgi:hypothetical protein
MFIIKNSELYIHINLNRFLLIMSVSFYVFMYGYMMFELYDRMGLRKFLQYSYIWVVLCLFNPIFLIINLLKLKLKCMDRFDTILYYLCKPENNLSDAIRIEKEIQQKRIFK